jgi:hypothetical protein
MSEVLSRLSPVREGGRPRPPCSMGQIKFTTRDISATGDGRPPNMPIRGKGRAFRANHFKLMF